MCYAGGVVMKILPLILTLLLSSCGDDLAYPAEIEQQLFSINCDYSTGEQICNGYKLKKSCKDKNVDLAYIIQLQYGYAWLNVSAKKELHDLMDCLEPISSSSAIPEETAVKCLLGE